MNGPPDASFAWLIEDAVTGHGYYDGKGWTKDHLKAVRYSRREDAERTVMELPHGWHLIGTPVEHGWHALGGVSRALPEPTPDLPKCDMCGARYWTCAHCGGQTRGIAPSSKNINEIIDAAGGMGGVGREGGAT